MIFNVPPGVIDGPGLCDTDLAKARTTRRRRRTRRKRRRRKQRTRTNRTAEQ